MIVGIALRFFWETIEWLLFLTITELTEFFLDSFPPPNQDGKRLYYFWSPKYRTFSWCMVILLGRLFTSSWECPWSRVWPVWEYSACSTPPVVADPSKALLLHHRACWKSEELCPSCLSLCVWSSCQPRIIVESLCLVPYDLIKTQPLSFSNQPSKWLQFRLFLHLTKAYQSIHFFLSLWFLLFPFLFSHWLILHHFFSLIIQYLVIINISRFETDLFSKANSFHSFPIPNGKFEKFSRKQFNFQTWFFKYLSFVL